MFRAYTLLRWSYNNLSLPPSTDLFRFFQDETFICSYGLIPLCLVVVFSNNIPTLSQYVKNLKVDKHLGIAWLGWLLKCRCRQLSNVSTKTSVFCLRLEYASFPRLLKWRLARCAVTEKTTFWLKDRTWRYFWRWESCFILYRYQGVTHF